MQGNFQQRRPKEPYRPGQCSSEKLLPLLRKAIRALMILGLVLGLFGLSLEHWGVLGIRGNYTATTGKHRRIIHARYLTIFGGMNGPIGGNHYLITFIPSEAHRPSVVFGKLKQRITSELGY